MSTAIFPKVCPDSSPFPIFNLNNFQFGSGYVQFSDIIGKYGNLHWVNNWTGVNYFGDLSFSGTLNNIQANVFALVSYLPNIIQSIAGLAHDPMSNTSSFDGNVTILNDGLIQENIAVGGKLVVATSITTPCVHALTMTAPNVNTHQLSIGGTPFQQDVAFLHVNGAITLPICRSTPIADLNLPIGAILTITVKAGFRIVFVDLEGSVLGNVDNTLGTNYLYQQSIVFSSEMTTIQCFDRKNKLLFS